MGKTWNSILRHAKTPEPMATKIDRGEIQGGPKKRTPDLFLLELQQMNTDFNLFFHCYNKKCITHKYKLMCATSPLICGHTT